MGFLGSLIGRGLGGALGNLVGGEKGKNIGSSIGGIGGSLLPFKKGGPVKRKFQPALLHKGEFVLPKGVKPTKKQKKAVKKLRKKRK